MERTFARAACFPALLVFVVLVGPGPAAAGDTREITTYSKKSGNTTYHNTETQENFGTKDKPDWKRIETREQTETRRTGESHVVDREIKIRKYAKGSKRATETITIEQVEQPVYTLEPTIKSQTTTTTTYGRVGGKRKKVKEVKEHWEVVEVTDRGEVFAEGTRVTKTRGPKGTTTTHEVMNRRGQWVPAPQSAGGGKKSAKKAASKAPTNAQKQGLPTNNPGQRGMIPDVPNAGKSPSYPTGPKVMPKSKY
jgi:hypothetical protein